MNEFDEKAKTWDTQPDRQHRTQVIAEAISNEIPFDPTFTAMEYGCGTGLLSFPLKDRFAGITLIDSSQGMLDVVREKIERDKVKNMDVLNLDLLESPDCISRSFSVIYCSMVLHHVKDVQKILTIWYSLLNSPGYLCIADLDLDNGLFHGAEFKGHNGFDRKELEGFAQKAGFSSVRFRTVYEITKEVRDGRMHTFPMFLMTCMKF